MTKTGILFLVFLMLFCMSLSACGQWGTEESAAAKAGKAEEEMTPEQARKKLQEMGIEYSEYSFLFRVRDRNIGAIKLFLKAGMDPDTPDRKRILSSSRGTTAFMYSVSYGPPEIAIAMIEAGADVNAKDHSGMTGLMHASLCGQPDVVNALISAGADVNASVGAGFTPLMYAVCGRSIGSGQPLIETLLDAATGLQAEIYGNGRRVSGGKSAVREESQESIECMKALIAAGADVNATMVHGETPLMFATLGGRPTMVKILLVSGADPHVKNMNGETAMAMAAGKGHSDIVQILEDAGVEEQ